MDFYLKLQKEMIQIYKINKILSIISLFLFFAIVSFLVVLFNYLDEFFYVYPQVSITDINYAIFGSYTPKMFTDIFITFCIVIIFLFSLCFLFSLVLIIEAKNFKNYNREFKRNFVIFWFNLFFPFVSWFMFFELRSKLKKISLDVNFLQSYDLHDDFLNENNSDNYLNSDDDFFIELTEDEKESELIKDAFDLYKKGLISKYDFLKIRNENKIFK